MSTKNVLALTSGIPLVSTSFGIRSLCCESIKNCSKVISQLISGGVEEDIEGGGKDDSAESFADRVIDMYSLPNIWKRQSANQV